MSSSMEQLYQQLILDHAKSPHGRGLSDGYAAESFQVNPTCGDEVRLRVHLADGAIERVSWEGQGCSISQASTSIMSELVSGTSVTTAEDLGEIFRRLMHARGEGLSEEDEDRLGDATALTGVARYPARIKCALLGWSALRDALIQSGGSAEAEHDATARPTEEDA